MKTRDAPDTGTVFAGYPANPKAGYPVKAGYRISGRIFVLTSIFLVKYKINFFKALTITVKVFSKHKKSMI
jgi:hypothetical protein